MSNISNSYDKLTFYECIKLGSEEFAVDILKIQEINRMTEITQVPRSPEFVEGVINLRGKVIPVIYLRKRFSLPGEAWGKDTRIVVMDIGRKIVGFIVDSVSEVLRLPSSTVEPPPPMIAGIDSEYIRGVGKLDDRLLILLDVNRLLDSEEADLPGEPSKYEKKRHASVVPPEKSGKTMEYRGLAGMIEVDKQISNVIEDISNKVVITKKDLQKLVDHVKSFLEGNLVEEDLELYGELGDLAKYINDAKKSLKSFDATKIADKDLPEASDQLEQIVMATEEATDKILTNTEEMLENQSHIAKAIEAIKGIKVNKNTKGAKNRDLALEELEEANHIYNTKLMDIMSACNFQDLTGQRIQKIIKLVKGIESKLMKMILSFNIKRQERLGNANQVKINKEKEMLAKIEDMELKGPAKEGEGVNQSEVDDLLNDLFG